MRPAQPRARRRRIRRGSCRVSGPSPLSHATAKLSASDQWNARTKGSQTRIVAIPARNAALKRCQFSPASALSSFSSVSALPKKFMRTWKYARHVLKLLDSVVMGAPSGATGERKGILMSSALMIYGATGYVGEHVARAAGSLGVKAIVAGREAPKLDRIASETGLERRAFGLDDPAAIDSALNRVAVVLNCAGPFKYTAEPLRSLPALPRPLSRHNRRDHRLRGHSSEGRTSEGPRRHASPGRRLRRGSDRLPGAAPEAETAVRDPAKARFPMGRPRRICPGTQRTAIEILQDGVRVRSNGTLTRPGASGKTISVDFGDGPVEAQLVPWGDVFTAYYSTGIPNIEDYVAARAPLRRQMAFGRAIAPLTKFAPIRNLLLMAVRPGPSAELRAQTRTHVWGEVADDMAVAPYRGCMGRKLASSGQRSRRSGPRRRR